MKLFSSTKDQIESVALQKGYDQLKKSHKLSSTYGPKNSSQKNWEILEMS